MYRNVCTIIIIWLPANGNNLAAFQRVNVNVKWQENFGRFDDLGENLIQI